MINNEPRIYDEGITVERLNSLLDEVTAKPFVNPALAAQTIRAALDLHGITLPVLEVEGGSGGYFGSSSADGPAILSGASAMTDPTMYKPPVDGEWIFKIEDANGPDNDFDDHLYVYIVMDLVEEDNTTEAFAAIVSKEDLGALSDEKYQDQKGRHLDIPHDGDRSGESDYQKTQRHTNNDNPIQVDDEEQ